MNIELVNMLDRAVLLLDSPFRCKLYTLYLKYRREGNLGTMLVDIPSQKKFDSGNKDDISNRIMMGKLTDFFLNKLQYKTTFLPESQRGWYICPLYDLELSNLDLVRKNSIAFHLGREKNKDIKQAYVDDTAIDIQGINKKLPIKPLIPPPEEGKIYVVSQAVYTALAGTRDDLVYITRTSPKFFDDSGMSAEDTMRYMATRREITALQNQLDSAPFDMKQSIEYRLWELNQDYEQWYDDHMIDQDKCIVLGTIDNEEPDMDELPIFQGMRL